MGTLIFHADSITDDDDEPQAGENDEGSRHAGDQSDPNGHDKKDDWDFAVRFRDIQRYGYLEPKLKKEMSEKAIQAVLNKARESLGPIQKPYRYQMMEAIEAEQHASKGAVAELDVEETLLNNLVPLAQKNSELAAHYQVRLEKDHGLVLLLDTSLSMKGEKLALLGVTVAAVCESVPASALCILGFDSEIHVIKEFGELIPVELAIERVLSIPPGGFTNITLGLKSARTRIDSTIFKQARVILVSDGRYTEGKNPVHEAKNLRMIYPVKIGKDPGGRSVMREIGDTGLGRFSEVREMHELPRFLLHAVRTWVK